MAKVYDMVIVGGGPGGCTAALYAARAGLDVVILEKLSAGGQMALSLQVDNYPGFDGGIDGFTLGERMRQGAERFGAKVVLAEVLSLELRKTPKRVETSEGTFLGRTVVYAAGADPRPLEVPGEAALLGRGVHTCAACDGMFYRGKTVAVVGGGNSAVADALLLARVAARVILVHRRHTLRSNQSDQRRLLALDNVQPHWNATVTQILGHDHVTGIRLRDVLTGIESELPCDAVFVSIGRNPATALVAGQLELDDSGYILAGETTCTNLPGVFAVGDVRTKALRQIVTATADGAVAVHFAQEFLAKASDDFRRSI